MHRSRDAWDVEADPAGGGDGRSGDRDDPCGVPDPQRHAGVDEAPRRGYDWQTVIGATGGKIGFYGVTPVGQPAGANQAAVILGNTDGEIGGLTISDPPTQAEVQALRNKCEELADDVRALSALIQALRTALVNAGLIKGWRRPAA